MWKDGEDFARIQNSRKKKLVNAFSVLKQKQCQSNCYISRLQKSNKQHPMWKDGEDFARIQNSRKKKTSECFQCIKQENKSQPKVLTPGGETENIEILTEKDERNNLLPYLFITIIN